VRNRWHRPEEDVVSTPESPARAQTSEEEDVELSLEADPADLAEQRREASVEDVPDPEETVEPRPPALDFASEVDAADSIVEVRLDDDDWE
jgi:hypothetical protein